MKILIKNSLRKTIAAALMPTLFLSFVLCCSPASMAQSNMPSMSSDVNVAYMPQNDEIKTKICLVNVRYCPLCECHNVTAILKDNSSKIFNLSETFFKSNDKFLSTALPKESTLNLHLALLYESPPKSLQKSIPLYLFDRVLRL